MSKKEMPFKVARMKVGDTCDWDGVSPIDGESVKQEIQFAGRHYVFTERSCFLVHKKLPTRGGRP